MPSATVDERVRMWWRWMSHPGSRLGTASGCAVGLALAAAAASRGGSWYGQVARVMFTLLLTQLWSYAVHRWVVHGCKFSPLWELHRRHHDPPPMCSTRVAVAYELALDLILGGAVLFPLAAVGVLDTVTLVFCLAAYMAGHIIIYHDDGPSGLVHRRHHRSADTNFSPYLMDVAFGTAVPGCEEQSDHMTPNIFLALCVALAWHALRSCAGGDSPSHE